MGQIAGRPKLSRDQIRSLQRHVSFSEDEIKDWYREFCQSTSRGQDDLFLTEQEFCKVYNSVYPGQSSEFAKHIFRTFDLTGDNRVSFKEFLIGLSFSGSDNPEKQLKWAFRVYDVHKTGYITQEDMTQIIQSVFKMIGPRTLRDNDVSDTPEAMADELFHQLDKDGDQRISWEEFCECAPSNPNVLQLLQCGPPESDEPAARD